MDVVLEVGTDKIHYFATLKAAAAALVRPFRRVATTSVWAIARLAMRAPDKDPVLVRLKLGEYLEAPSGDDLLAAGLTAARDYAGYAHYTHLHRDVSPGHLDRALAMLAKALADLGDRVVTPAADFVGVYRNDVYLEATAGAGFTRA